MTPLEAIRSNLTSDIFIFPSEIAANFWRRNGAYLSESGILTGNRFISWDTFKERYLNVRNNDFPVNRTIRGLFGSYICYENERDRHFRELVPARFSTSSRRFAGSVARIIPSLPSLIEDAELGIIDITGHLLSDYRLLLSQYQRFLANNDLYEPAYVRAETSQVDDRFILMYPDLIEDFPRYSELISDIPSVDPPETDRARFHRFSNQLIEIDWLAEEISTLLSSVHPGDIVVTVAALEMLEPEIREAFRIRSIPIDIRAGRPLSRSPFGSFFVEAGVCVAAGFDLERLHPLLLDPRIPWRNPGLNQELIRFGVDHRCGRNGETDILYERLTVAGKRRLAGYYRSIRDTFTHFVRARDVSALRTLVLSFTNDFLDARALPSGQLRVFEAVLESLGKLESIETMIGNEYIVDDAFSLWTKLLTDQIYVPSSSVRSMAVTFYPYRVAAGINPRYHFVVNSSDPTVRVVHDAYSHLPSHARGGTDRRDVTDLFLRAYADSGTHVSFSASDVTQSGAQLLPSFLQRNTDAGKIDSAESRDGFDSEHEYWRTGSVPSRFYASQIDGFSTYLSRYRSGDDYTRALCNDTDLASTLRASKTNDAGEISISSTALDSWIGCPFAYLTTNLLGVRDVAYAVVSVDPMREGGLLHELAEHLFDPESTAGASRIDPLLDEIVRDEARRFPQPNPLLLDERLSAIRSMLEGLLASDLARFETVATERSYEIRVGDISLNGRVDRVDRIDAGLKIVDYKRGRVPTRGSLVPYSEASSFQIPIYALLVGSEIGDVVAGSYFSFKKKKETVVFGSSGWFDNDAFDEFLETAKLKIGEMAESLRNGDYRVRKKAGGCDRCTVRSICRKRYVIT